MKQFHLPLTMMLVTLAGETVAQQRPNIVLIMADDLGYGDLGCYGQRLIATPHIDQMAKEGMLFTQAYAGAPVSAPSRASLMTGQHTGHTRVRGNKEYWRDAPLVRYGVNEDYALVGQMPYDARHEILPEVLHKLGYSTGIFGKWAGGFEGSESTPDKRGVDEFYGFICQFQAHLYYPNFLNEYSRERGDTAVHRVVLQGNIDFPMFGPDYAKRTDYSAHLIHRRALEWLGRQDGKKPFCALLTYTLPHAELSQPQDALVQHYKQRFFTDKTWGGSEGSRYNAVEHTHAQFAAMVARFDAYVGEVLQLLREQGLDKNTIVIVTSDNGPHEEGGADPEFFGRDGKLRGLKRQCYEGGIRIPFIVRWPGQVAEGKSNDQMVAFYDVLPTFAELAGGRKVAQRYETAEGKRRKQVYDGLSFLPTLTGKGEQRQHPWLYWEFSETDQMALRQGRWKLLVVKGVPRLYDLQTDVHEDHDVASQHPEIVKAMVRTLKEQHTPSTDFPITLPQ